jgi:hypothetical protein
MTPHPFYQEVLIIIAYCRQTGLYVPVVYCLMTHKTEAMYKRVIAELLSCAQLLDPKLVQLDVRNYASDFEAALFNACEYCFPNGVHIGCFFHFKQAIRKYMRDKCHFDTDTISSFMEQVTLLTIIDPDEILIYGVPYLRQMFEPEGLDERTCEKWVKFWSYFERQWTKVTDPASWNIHKMNGEAKDFINRTNNPCENYNNRYSSKFNTSGRTVSFFEWLEITKEEALWWEEQLEDVRKGRRGRVIRHDWTIPDLPQDYIDFRENYNE